MPAWGASGMKARWSRRSGESVLTRTVSISHSASGARSTTGLYSPASQEIRDDSTSVGIGARVAAIGRARPLVARREKREGAPKDPFTSRRIAPSVQLRSWSIRWTITTGSSGPVDGCEVSVHRCYACREFPVKRGERSRARPPRLEGLAPAGPGRRRVRSAALAWREGSALARTRRPHGAGSLPRAIRSPDRRSRGTTGSPAPRLRMGTLRCRVTSRSRRGGRARAPESVR